MSPQRPTDVPPIDDWNRLLDGRVAVVTGGGDGIGAAIASLFAQHGALVEIADLDPDRADATVQAIERHGGHARAHRTDVTVPSDVERLASDVLLHHGHVEVLINNVGDYRPLTRFGDSTPESWRAMYDINLFHVFAVTRAFLGSMTTRRQGLDRQRPLGGGHARVSRRAGLRSDEGGGGPLHHQSRRVAWVVRASG